MKKRLAILGSTGSIGSQALEVIDQHANLFTVEVLSTHSNADSIIAQAKKYQPNTIVVTEENAYNKVKKETENLSIKVFFGYEALCDIVQWDHVDLVFSDLGHFEGIDVLLSAIEAGKPIALSNKESLVIAGKAIMEKAREKNSMIIPADSEHSALFQCLIGEHKSSVEKVILTASGGPFLGKKTNFLVNVKKEHALQNPVWEMSAKSTIDSATLMNKGLEMIGAKWMFELENDQFDIIVQPEALLHSIVLFKDGSMKSQMGIPDMKIPIQYALTYPQRISNDLKKFNFKDHNSFTFESPDYKTFRNLSLAQEAMEKGGNLPCILNAANDVVVHAFLNNKLGFIEMSEIIENVMSKITFLEQPSLDELKETDAEARKCTGDLAKSSQLYN